MKQNKVTTNAVAQEIKFSNFSFSYFLTSMSYSLITRAKFVVLLGHPVPLLPFCSLATLSPLL